MPVIMRRQPQAILENAIVDDGTLPVENTDDFCALLNEMRRYLEPVGPLEEDQVGTTTQLLWRKHHLVLHETGDYLNQQLAQKKLERQMAAFRGVSTMPGKPLEAVVPKAQFDALLKEYDRILHSDSDTSEPARDKPKAVVNKEPSDTPTGGSSKKKSTLSEKHSPDVSKTSSADNNESADTEYREFLLSLGFNKCISRFEFKEKLDAMIERALDRLRKLQAERLGLSQSIAGARAPLWGRVRQ